MLENERGSFCGSADRIPVSASVEAGICGSAFATAGGARAEWLLWGARDAAVIRALAERGCFALFSV